jgi:hypothetical protein
MMLRRAIPVLLFSLFGLFATSAAADPVRITAGSVFLPGLFQSGTLDVSGTQGFTMTATTDNAPNAFRTCSVPECVGGTPLDLFVHLGGGPTLLNGQATLNGVTYPVDHSADPPWYTNLFFRGTAVAPPAGDGATTVMAPFTLDGGFYLGGTGLLQEFTGAGTATLSLRPYGLVDFPPSWFIEGIRYDFADPAPVPEPATLTLTATALAGAYLARRRRTRRTGA